MDTLGLFIKIKEAFETSTHNYNRFKEVIDSEKWDDKYFADDEYVFIKADMSFSTPSFDPFNMKWKASAIWDDGSVLYL